MRNIYREIKEPEIKVSVKSMIVNGFLAAFKFIAGIMFHSTAIVSDAVHSLSDMFTTVFVIIGIKVSRKESDERHPYGHDRYECLASVLLGTLLGLTGIGVAISGIKNIINYESLKMPGVITIFAAIISIVVKEWMFRFTKKVADDLHSGIVMADAWHHRSDALSSVGALIGVCGARMGIKVLDPIASILICVFIMKATYEIFKDAINKMLDVSCEKETIDDMKKICNETEGVKGVKSIKTRLFGSKMYAEIEIVADGGISLSESDVISEKIHHRIENYFPLVKHCSVIAKPE